MPPHEHVPELDNGVTRRLFAVGLTLQDTAAVAADPRVRGKIEEALDDLEQVIADVRGHLFGLRPALSWDSPDGKAGYWLRQSELALDLAATALLRAAEVDGDWDQDVAATLRSKLDMLRESVNEH
jgi:two-component system, NarL family, sensor histidine kinase DevS